MGILSYSVGSASALACRKIIIQRKGHSDLNYENITLDRTSKTPLYLQLKKIFLDAIREKELCSGDLLPSESEIAKLFGISKATVRQCMGELSNEGYIEKRRNRGTIILGQKLNIGYSSEIGDFSERIREMGMQPKTELLALKVEECNKQVAQLLNFDESKKIIHLVRLRYANNFPIVYIDSFLPYETCRPVLSHDLESESLYSILDQEPSPQLHIHHVVRTVYASEALPEIAEKFNVRTGCAMLTVETIAYNKNGFPIEYSVSYSPNARNQYSFTLNR